MVLYMKRTVTGRKNVRKQFSDIKTVSYVKAERGDPTCLIYT
jgi:hypothetical protein